jgi:ketosteroid isomerase-like protein
MTELKLDSLTTWLAAYGDAWQNGDADAVITLFSDNAKYYETPFSDPMIGRPAIHNYWREGAAESQTDIRFTYQALAVTENKGLAQWQATFTRLPSGNRVELDGFLTAEFNPTGKCTLFREWWHRRETENK